MNEEFEAFVITDSSLGFNTNFEITNILDGLVGTY